jgi:serine/threonine protein phosphatase PrpC
LPDSGELAKGEAIVMKTMTGSRAGIASDPGLQRPTNEDRVYVDEDAGVFLVVDGLGGHAAGEKAAETAVQTIAEHLAESHRPVADRVRSAIAAANNRIYELARDNQEWAGMACVLTLAVAHDDKVTFGHVGDSRLYLVWNGTVRKLTSDHSPVGEREDQGELTEQEAMLHPRRHEIFRDVGSRPREADDEQFIETRSLLFRPDAALLLCSDGLSDALTSAEISEVIERYDGDAERVALELVDAANEASGKDNISVVFVAGPDFLGVGSKAMLDARTRHSITRTRRRSKLRRLLVSRLPWLIAGILLGMLLWAQIGKILPAGWTPIGAARVSIRAARVSERFFGG